ncbi:SAM-dependent methyltransferase [Nocardioides limicola]|uniref:SAM-dependent methyltransferase n=1 Tax=Nocardioides limicola TaxID=2803368 RepID=UPI00193BB407|nr:methyltransferase domain-containing protein [Nocardioides sp. DJM-14]
MPQLPPLYDDLSFLAPLSQERADRLVRFISGTPTIVDVGCGWAELLLQAVAASPHARGVGLDLKGDAIREGRARAEARGLGDRVSLEAVDARSAELPADVSAAVCIGASQIWADPEADPGPLDYRTALSALRGMLPRGGRLVYGEAIWSQPPTDAAAAPLSGRLDEFVTLPALVELAVEAAFQPVLVGEATLDEWDVFESGFCAGHARWLAQNPPDHPDAAAVRERLAAQRAGYLSGYRGVLGFGYLGLLAV